MSKKTYDFSDFEEDEKPNTYDFSDFDEPAAEDPSLKGDLSGEPEEAAIRKISSGISSGVLGGFADELAGGVGGAMDYVSQGGKLPLEDYYRIRRDLVRGQMDKDRAESPGLYTGSEIAGAVLSPASKLMAPVKGAGALSNLGRVATGGAAMGLGMSEADLTRGEVGEAALDTAIGAGVAPVFDKAASLVGAGAGKITSKVGDVVKGGLKKLGKIGANVPEEITEDYLKRADEINAYDLDLEDIALTVNEVLAGAKGRLKSAKEALDRTIFNAKEEARDQLAKARHDQTRASTDLKLGLQNQDTSVLRRQIVDAVEDLKNVVIEKSNESYRVLDKYPEKSIPTSGMGAIVREAIENLNVAGGEPLGDAALKSQRTLGQILTRLSRYPGDIPLTEAKKILQQLDKDDIFSDAAGSFAPQADAAKKQLRGHINRMLRDPESPSYVEEFDVVMNELQPLTDLLSTMSKRYGKESQVLDRLGEIASQKGQIIDRPNLDRMGRATGAKFGPGLDEFSKKQEILRNPNLLRQAEAELPEAARLRAAEEGVARLRDPRTLEAFPEAQALREARESYDELGGWTERSSEQRLKSLMQNRANMQNREVLETISGRLGRDLGGELQNIKTRDAFTKQDTQGSRRVQLGRAIGGGLVGGGVGYGTSEDPLGGMIGASAGFAADRYAGQIFKKVLDGYRFGDAFAQRLKPVLERAVRSGQLPLTHRLLYEKNKEYKEYVDKHASRGDEVFNLESEFQLGPSRFGKYEGVLKEALERGGRDSLNTTHFVLMNRPDYRQMIKEIEEAAAVPN